MTGDNLPTDEWDTGRKTRSYFLVEGAKGHRPKTTASWQMSYPVDSEQEKERLVRRWAERNGLPESATFEDLLEGLAEEASASRARSDKKLSKRLGRLMRRMTLRVPWG